MAKINLEALWARLWANLSADKQFISKSSAFVNLIIDDVFAYTNDTNSLRYWMADLVYTRLVTQGQFGLNTTLIHKYKVGRRIDEVTVRVPLFEPPFRWVYLGTSTSVWFERTFQFESTTLGTKVYLTERRRPKGLFETLFASAAANHYQKQIEKTVESLKKVLDERPRRKNR